MAAAEAGDGQADQARVDLLQHLEVLGPQHAHAVALHLVEQRERGALQRRWSELTYRMQALRDNPDCAREAFETTLDEDDPGLSATLTFDLDHDVAAATAARRSSAGASSRRRTRSASS